MIDAPFMLGKVESVDESTNIITFSVPYVIENMSKYPEAYPIGTHSHKMNVGDSVFLTKISELNRFVYQPIDFNPFIGVRYSDKNYIELNGDDKLTIKVGGKDILSVSSTSIKFLDSGLPLFNQLFTCRQCLVTGADQASNEMLIP